MYRYNSQFLQISADFIYPIFDVNSNGFLPLNGEIDTMRIKKETDKATHTKPHFDPLKIKYLNKLVDDVEGVKLVFAVSPSWYGANTEELAPIMDICQKRNIPLLDFSNDPKYIHNNVFFKDGSHLNAKGADEFTLDFIKQLNI